MGKYPRLLYVMLIGRYEKDSEYYLEKVRATLFHDANSL